MFYILKLGVEGIFRKTKDHFKGTDGIMNPHLLRMIEISRNVVMLTTTKQLCICEIIVK